MSNVFNFHPVVLIFGGNVTQNENWKSDFTELIKFWGVKYPMPKKLSVPLYWFQFHREISYISLKSIKENGQFTDVFNKNEHSQVPLPNQSARSLLSWMILLFQLKAWTKALGLDKLHPRVLKELGSVFAHLFQQSIDMGEIPKEWSLANICPVFKKRR